MSFLIHHIKRGNLILPVIFIILLMNFVIIIPVLQDQEVADSLARGYSQVSIDLEASFKQIPGAEKSADAGQGDTGAENAGAGKVLNLKEGSIARKYFGKVLRKIEQNKFYPGSELENEREGVVKLSFLLLRNGKLSVLKLLKSSGNKVFDRAALNAIENSGPFPKFPKEIEAESLPVVIDIEYKVEG